MNIKTILNILPKKIKTSYHSDTCLSMFITAQLISARSWTWPRCLLRFMSRYLSKASSTYR